MTATPAMTSLRPFLDLLRRRGELVTIDAEVDADQEIAEIHRRVIAAGGPALLFRNVKNSPFPVVTNLFGTLRRVELAFGEAPEQYLKAAVELAEGPMPPKMGTLWQQRGLLGRFLNLGTGKRRCGAVGQRQMSPPRLEQLPMLTSWPEDGGAFVTLPLVYTEHPETNVPNLGMYRMHRYDDERTGMHWQIGKGGGFHYHAAQALGQALPVTVFLGGPPALILSAIAPLPEGVPELLFASFVQGHKLSRFEAPGCAHPLIGEAEFALAGEVDPAKTHPEGPFGDHYGYYSLEHDYPVFECQRVYHRADAIYPATVVGKPRQEDYYLGEYLQRLLAPLFPLVMPGVRDLWSYGETGFHALSAAVVEERYAREAMGSAFRILGEGQLRLTKFLLVVDRPMDLTDFKSVLTYVLERFDPATDLYVFNHLSQDTLDYTGPEVNKGSKGILLGIGEPRRELPAEWQGSLPAGTHDPQVLSPGCLVLGAESYAESPELPSRVAADPSFSAWPLIVLVDRPEQAAASALNFLWTVFTRFEPAGDIHAVTTEVRHHLSYQCPLVIDARMKPWYPGELFCAPEIAALVSQRWDEYFPSGKVEMGSSDFANLIP